MADFTLADHGSVVILTAVSKAAKAWASEHLPSDAQTWARHGSVIEPRYVDAIVDGIINDGLEVQ